MPEFYQESSGVFSLGTLNLIFEWQGDPALLGLIDHNHAFQLCDMDFLCLFACLSCLPRLDILPTAAQVLG